MLAEIGEIILSPVGLVVGVVYAVLSQIILQSLNLIFGKSKNAILRFTTERSENQRAIRCARIKKMRGDTRTFQLYVSQLNFHLHMVAGTLILTGMCFLIAILIKHMQSDNDPIVLFVVGGFTAVFSITLLFQALVVQQDLIRSVIEPPLDKRGVPLWEPIIDDDKAPL